jgi:hypothetical protein
MPFWIAEEWLYFQCNEFRGKTGTFSDDLRSAVMAQDHSWNGFSSSIHQMLFSDHACCWAMRQLPPRVMATAGSIVVRW